MKLQRIGYAVIALGTLTLFLNVFLIGLNQPPLLGVLILFIGLVLTQFPRSLAKRKAFVKFAIPITLSLTTLGFVLRFTSSPGAGVLIVLSVLFLSSVITPIIARNRFDRWRRYVNSTPRFIALMLADTLGLALIILSFLFRFMRWPGSINLAILGIVLLVFAFFAWNKLLETIFQRQQKTQAELEKSYELLHEKNTEILDSIAYAKRIQSAILPPHRIVKQYLPESFILYKPKDVVAGDFYWMETMQETVYFAAADCTGHGVPGAMVSVVCVNGLNRSVREFGLREPGKILDKTRELVIKEFEKSEEEVKDGMDIALCALNTSTNTMMWAGAHNPLWIIRNGASEIEELKADKQPIGQYHAATAFTTHEVALHPGDTIYIFSDGYPDQFGGKKGKKYKSGNFKKKLLQLASQPIQSQLKLLDKEFEEWRGELEQIDDVCVIGVRI